jgi:hypothetical protein
MRYASLLRATTRLALVLRRPYSGVLSGATTRTTSEEAMSDQRASSSLDRPCQTVCTQWARLSRSGDDARAHPTATRLARHTNPPAWHRVLPPRPCSGIFGGRLRRRTVKVLDFGLAKLAEANGAGSVGRHDASRSPTLTRLAPRR